MLVDIGVRREEIEVIGRELGAHQVGVAGRRELDLDVEGRNAGAPVIGRGEQAKIDIGVAAHEDRQEVAHEPEGRQAVRHDHLALAFDGFLRVARALGGTIEKVAGGDHLVQDARPLEGQDRAARPAIEQLGAELRFQAVDAAADGGLLHAQIDRRAREAAGPRHRGEDAKLVPVQVRRGRARRVSIDIGIPQYVFVGFRLHIKETKFDVCIRSMRSRTRHITRQAPI